MVGCSIIALCASAQTPVDFRSFDVASIKKSEPGCVDAGTAPPLRLSPGRIVLHCVTARSIIRSAFNDLSNMTLHHSLSVVGGPSWLDSDRYDIEATATNAVATEMMGVLLQRLLKDRFNLKTHTESRETSVYLLAVSGKSKLKPANSASCVERDLTVFPPPRGTAVPNYCGSADLKGTRKTPILDLFSVDMSGFGAMLTNYVSRPVIDRTGITGKYDIHLEFAREEPPSGPVMLNGVLSDAPRPEGSMGPSIFSALQQQTGLKLIAGSAPQEAIVVDSVEPPTAN